LESRFHRAREDDDNRRGRVGDDGKTFPHHEGGREDEGEIKNLGHCLPRVLESFEHVCGCSLWYGRYLWECWSGVGDRGVMGIAGLEELTRTGEQVYFLQRTRRASNDTLRFAMGWHGPSARVVCLGEYFRDHSLICLLASIELRYRNAPID
jgi:hypothetical protein